MADAGFFRVRDGNRNQQSRFDISLSQGTSSDQDNRFSDKEKKLLKTMKFEDNLVKKVDMSKVKMDVLKPWITKRIYEMLKMEDDVVVEFIFNQLKEKFPDPRKMQINLTGLLSGKHARMFMGELWAMLDSAQNSEIEIPTELMNTNDSLNTTPHPCYEWQINLSSEANKFPTRNCDESCPKTSPTGPKYRKTEKTTRVFKRPRK